MKKKRNCLYDHIIITLLQYYLHCILHHTLHHTVRLCDYSLKEKKNVNFAKNNLGMEAA